MMRKISHIVFLLSLLTTFSVFANSTFDEAVESYNKKDFTLAAQKFDSIITISPQNISAYFNLGMARMKNKEYGKAIWAFEKVLKYHPNDTEAKDNIRECYFQLYPNFYWEFQLNGFQSILYSISPNTWGIMSVISSVVLSLMIILFKMNQSPSIKRVVLISGFAFLFLFLFSFIAGYFVKQYQTQENKAVVIKKDVQSLFSKAKVKEGQILECSNCEGDTITFMTKNKQNVQLLREDVGFI